MAKHIIRDIVDLTFFGIDPVTGKEKVEFVIDSLKSATVEGTAEQTDARGGRGNALLAIVESQREVAITCTDAVLIPELFAARMGTDLKKFTAASKGTLQRNESHAVAAQTGDGVYEIALKNVPKDAKEALVYVTINGVRKEIAYSATPITDTDAGKFSIATVGNKLELTHADLDGNAIVNVHFKSEIDNGEQIVIDAEKFASKTYRVTGDYFTTEISGDQEVVSAGQIEILRAKFDSGFNLAFAPDGDPQTFEFKLRALKQPGKKELMYMTMYV